MTTLQDSRNITVSILSCSNSNFEFTRYYFSESVLFYTSWSCRLVVVSRASHTRLHVNISKEEALRNVLSFKVLSWMTVSDFKTWTWEVLDRLYVVFKKRAGVLYWISNTRRQPLNYLEQVFHSLQKQTF